jgi:ATP-dependent exoDNAse (exonuclease V) beta subunit
VKDKIELNDEHNKTWNMVYVALTRSKSELVIAIDKALFTGKPSVGDVINGIEALNFKRLDLRKA